ncbi:MAG: hypothetical protein FJ161_00135 [Gammaproteobacteria bacterium]|nr:hypothetical protein [Gammaproteobacteria bacterium]
MKTQALKMHQSMHLSLTPSLKQAIELLSFSHEEIERTLSTWREQNPFFDFTYPSSSKSDESFLENIPDRSICPIAALMHDSLDRTILDYSYWPAAMELIEAIDARGFCPIEVFESFSSNTQNALDRWLISLSPIGLGARTTRQCLLWQLQYRPELQGLKQYQALYEYLSHGDFSHKLEELNTKELNLLYWSPANMIMHYEPTLSIEEKYNLPDILIEKNEHGYSARLNPALVPNIEILDWPENLSKREECRKHYQEAVVLKKMITTRFNTMLRVASAIAEYQKDFFTYGESALQPMILSDIALKLNLHESTISRTLQHKTIATPFGIWDCKKLFSRSIKHHQDTVSDRAIKHILNNIIEHEPQNNPLSDEALTKILNRQGFCIARRTIAKYREELGIANSHQRRTREQSNHKVKE